MKMGKSDPSESLLGTREAWWDSSFAPTPVYDLDQLTSGNVVVGPGLAESDATTLVIPPGWECQIDEYETAVLRLSEN
jgi:acetone carboxylase beta subunit